MKFDILIFFENLLRKVKFCSYLTRITGPLYENIFAFTHFAGFFLERENVQVKVIEKIKTNIENSITENRAIYGLMWKNMLEPGRLRMTI